MADGNMGDLSFSLTLKSRIEDETRKIVKELNKVDETGTRAQRALNGISEAVRDVGSGNANAFSKLESVERKVSDQSDNLINGFQRIKGILKEMRQAGANFEIFPNKTSKGVNDAEKAYNKLSSFLREINSKAGQGLNVLGVDATQGIRQASSELLKYRSILEQIKNNGGVHPVSGLTASDITKSAGFEKSVADAKNYAREIKQALKEVDDTQKRSTADAANEYARRKRQQEMQKAAQEAELKAMSDYAKRYMELQEAKRKSDAKASVDTENNARKMSDLYARLSYAREKAMSVEQKGLAIGADTSKLSSAVALATELQQKMLSVNHSMMGKNGNAGYADYASELRQVKILLDSAVTSQKELNRAKEQANAAAVKASIEEEKRNEQIVEDMIQRRVQAKQRAAEKEAEIERQRQGKAVVSAQIAQEQAKSEIRWNEQRAKANSEALQRQMKASVEEEKKSQVSLFSNGFDTSVLEKRIALLNRMKEIQEQLSFYQPKVQYAYLDYETSKKFGNANTPEMRHKEDDLQRLRSIVSELEAEFNKLGGNAAFKNVDDQIKNLEQTIARLKESGGTLNIGKMLGLENKPTDEFALAQQAASAKEAHVKKQNELNAAFEKYFRLQEQAEAAEKRLAEAIARTNQARRESVAASRQQAETLVRDRVKELESQRQQIQSLFGSGKGVLDVQELTQLRQAFSQITSEINTLRGAMSNLSSYSIRDLFSMGRGTSDYAPLIGNMRTVLSQKRETANLERQHQQEVQKTAATVRKDLVSALEQARNSTNGMNSALQDMKSLFLQGGIVYGAQQFLMSIIQTGGELERQHIALQSILGDMQNADTMFGQIKQLALESPFTFSELNKDVKQLAAYGVEYDELYDTTKRLADMASGLGVSFERIALAFGQVQARGWLDGKELRQISYAGIPLLDKLSKMYSQREGKKVSTSEIKTRISNRNVSFEDVKSVFWDMTDAGGQFYNMQQTLSETLLGRYNKLKDAWEIMLSDFASGTSKSGQMLMGVLDTLTSIVQGMHTLGPVMLAAFSGFAIKKLLSFQSGNISSFLTNKSKVADGYAQKLAEGGKLTAIEREILVYKNRITNADLQQLARARALTTADLNRLRISGSITAEQYKIYRAIVLQQNGTKTLSMQWSRFLVTMRTMSLGSIWTNFSTTAKASFLTIATGARALGATLWSAIGGLPGLIITGATMAFTYFSNKSNELKQEMGTVASELKDRYKGISDMLRDTPAMTIIAKGDTKEIDNAIDTYKEKIKQIAPYDYSNLVMKAEEKESHKERLAYLSQQLELIQQANAISQSKLGNSSTYKDLKSSLEDLSKTYDGTTRDAQNYQSVDEVQRRYESIKHDFAFKTFAKQMEDKVKNVFGDIANNDAARSAAQQAMTSIMAQMEIPEDKANVIRASVMQSFGLVDGWLEDQVASKMSGLISSTSATIANKIRSGQKLTDAEQAKVRELMDDAKQQLIYQYPELESTLQGLLNDSHFTAVIDLVTNNVGKYDEVQTEMSNRIPGMLKKENREKYVQYVNSWGAGNSWYDARNKAKSDIDAAWNNLKSARESNANKDEIAKLKDEYDTARSAAKDLLNYDYSGDDKKSNKEKDKSRKEDAELKAWQERLNSYKTARQTYQKNKTVMSEAAAKQLVEGLYDNVSGLDLDNYKASIEKLEKELDFSKSPERKRALTSLKRELADWDFSEVLKPQWERIAQDFVEALEDGLNSFNLYKSLIEKTGSKEFAMQAFTGGEMWDDAAYDMAEKFRELTGGMEPDTKATDATAKHYLVDVLGNQQAYDEWKKLTEYVRNGYNEALKEAADILKETASYEEQKLALENEYIEAVKKANAIGGDTGERMKLAADRKRTKGTAGVDLQQMENSDAYIKFFTRSIQQSKQSLAKYAQFMKSVLGKALEAGAITAEEYSKKIEDINKRMVGLNDFQFAGGGLNGMVSSQRTRGEQQVKAGQDKYNQAKNAYDMAQTIDQKLSAQEGMQAGESMMNGGSQLMQGADEMAGTIGMIDTIIHGINDLVQGLNDTFQDIKETAEALGADTDSDEWTDANSFFSGFSSASQSATDGWDSLKNGNMGGVVYGVVGSFTGWIKAFAAGHDQKLDNQIKIAERQEQLLKNISNNVETVIENTLGGIYNYKATDYTRSNLEQVKSDYETRQSLEAQLNGTGSSLKYLNPSSGGALGILTSGISNLFSNSKSKLKKKINKIVDYSDETYAQTEKALSSGTAYDAQLASLMAQRDTLQQQRNAEASKKKKDESKINDYDSQIEEMRLKIQAFAQDFLKSVYSIDMKSWASELTDAVVSAWSAGEDAVDAYKEKVKDLVKDLTKNILSQKIMEQALQKPLDYLTGLLEEKGQLDEGDMEKLATQLYEAGETSVSNITGILDALKKKGLDLSEDSSSSTSNTIKSITEETADLLAAYLNAIRLDVSAIRGMEANEISSMGEIQKSQLEQLRSISQNTLRNAEAAERIEISVAALNDNFDRVISGTKSLRVR